MSVPTTRQRLPYEQACSIAEELVDLLAPHCEKLQVCGSIRRNAITCGDIDLVAVPKLAPIAGLFGPSDGHVDVLNAELDELCGRQVIHQARRSDGKIAGWGPKLRKLTFRNMPVQIRHAESDNLGLVVLIATGPAAYSHAFVTPRGTRAAIRSADGTILAYRNGMLPPGWSVEKGFRLHRAHIFVATPTEEHVYDALGWRYTDPEDRR